MAEAPINLPDFLRMTPEQIAVSERIQEEVRQAMHGRVQATQEEAQLIRGIHAERTARANLSAFIEAKEPGGETWERGVSFYLTQLADALADQGRYAEAAALHPTKEQAAEYAAIQTALDRPDDAICDCPADEVVDPVSKKTLRIPARNKIAEVYSIKLKRMVPLIRCEKCEPDRALNARPLTATGALMRRETAMAAVAQGQQLKDVDLLK